jgi:hypothetical protein
VDKAIVERAVAALAALNGQMQHRSDRLSRQDNPPAVVVQPGSEVRGANAACGSSDCAGCYDVGDSRKIHPPKCGDAFRRWREWLEGKGRVH